MELTTIRVKQKSLTCRTCETEFFGYSEAQDSPVKLYECEECTAFFSLSPERNVSECIQGKSCPDCDAPLVETLVEKTQAGICPMCEDRDYYGSGDVEEVDLETYAL